MENPKTKRIRTQSREAEEAEAEAEEEEEEEWRDWSSLTSPILLSILHLLHSLHSFTSFRSVCRTFRSISLPPPPSLSPLLLLTPVSHSPSPSHSPSLAFFDFTLNLLYSPSLPFTSHSRKTLSCSHAHLVTTTFSSSPYKPLLFNILSRRQTRLPKTPIFFDRALFSSSPSSPLCSITLFEIGGCPALFQHCRPGDKRWTIYDFRRQTLRLHFLDAIFFKNEIYALTLAGQFGLVRLSSPDPEFVCLGQINNATGSNLQQRKLFLAECNGRLMLFCIRVGVAGVEGNVKIEVVDWEFDKGEWLDVGSLGDKAVFFGSNGFAATVTVVAGAGAGAGVRANSVYYAGCKRNEWIVYSMEDHVSWVVDACASHRNLARGWTDDYPVWVFPSIC